MILAINIRDRNSRIGGFRKLIGKEVVYEGRMERVFEMHALLAFSQLKTYFVI